MLRLGSFMGGSSSSSSSSNGSSSPYSASSSSTSSSSTSSGSSSNIVSSSGGSSSILSRLSRTSVLMTTLAGLALVVLCSLAFYFSAHREDLMHSADVTAVCSREPSSLDKVILMGPLDAPGSLLSGTGTGHWFHLLESVLPSLMPAHDQVWGDAVLGAEASDARDSAGFDTNSKTSRKKGTLTSKAGTSDIYIVFTDEDGVDDLGPFGRFTLASILTGGRYRRVHLAYAKHVSRRHPNDQVVMLQNFEVRFSIDFETQGVQERFMKSALGDAATTSALVKCAREVLYVPLQPYRGKLGTQDWLYTKGHLESFQTSYKRACSLASKDSAYTTMPEASLPEHRNRVVAANVSSLKFADANDRVTVSVSHPHIGVGLPQDYTPTVLVYQRDSNRKFKHIEPVLEYLETHLNGPTSTSTSTISVAGGGNSHTLRQSTRRSRGLRGIKTILLNSTYRSSTASTTSANTYTTTNTSTFTTTVTSDNITTTAATTSAGSHRQTLAAYANFRRVPRWNIKLYMHDEVRVSPCELLANMHSADVFLTPHGFQSVLLLYQPLHSVFAEVFPYRYFKPHLYGNLQWSFHERFDAARALFIGRSATSELFFDNAIVNYMWPTEDACEHSIVCRHYSRLQDVTPSTALLQELVNYLHSHYYHPEA